MRREKHVAEAYADEVSGANMTPMIDVTFQLLIFFILVGKFRQPEGRMDAELPNDGPSPGVIVPVEDVRIYLRDTGDIHSPGVAVEFGEFRYTGTQLLKPGSPLLAELRRSHPEKIPPHRLGRVRFSHH